jgi:hypothetical protein
MITVVTIAGQALVGGPLFGGRFSSVIAFVSVEAFHGLLDAPRHSFRAG